jgi:hypothetical protein
LANNLLIPSKTKNNEFSESSRDIYIKFESLGKILEGILST